MAANTRCPEKSVIESMLAGNLTAEEEAKVAESPQCLTNVSSSTGQVT